MTEFKAMLAAKFPGEDALVFPMYVQRKLDGIRASVVNGKLVTRTLKPVPNLYIRSLFEDRPELEGFDGELIVGDPTDKDCYRTTVSGVMSSDGEPDFTYYVFDLWNTHLRFGSNGIGPLHYGTGRLKTLIERIAGLEWNGLASHIKLVESDFVTSLDDLNKVETRFIAEGYEGAILRGPNTFYKFGRGSKTKFDLIKMKRFVDFEAIVIGVYEEMENTNEATTNLLGRTERSSHKANKVGKGTLGGLILRREDGVEFRCGTGFDAKMRKELWADAQLDLVVAAVLNQPRLAGRVLGRTVKIKSFPIGEHEKPRHPVWLGWRDERDM
jgi:DNA ligase-1